MGIASAFDGREEDRSEPSAVQWEESGGGEEEAAVVGIGRRGVRQQCEEASEEGDLLQEGPRLFHIRCPGKVPQHPIAGQFSYPLLFLFSSCREVLL